MRSAPLGKRKGTGISQSMYWILRWFQQSHIYGDKRGRIHIPKEYRSDVTYGPSVKALSAVLYSEGVMSNDRIAAFLNAASAERLKLSAGSIYGFCCRLSEASVESISHLESHMLDLSLIHI